MARALFAISICLGAAAALSNSGKEEMSDLVASMSVRDALNRLGDELPPEVATLVEASQGESTARKAKFLQTGARGMRKDALGTKGGVNEARKKLNGMMEETQEGFDREWVRCTSTIENEMGVLNETKLDIELYKAQNSQASGDHIRAQGAITTLDSTATRLDDERGKAIELCTMQIMDLKKEIAIMVNDSIILQRILGMIDCPDKVSLVQCNDTNATFEKPELRAQLSKVQSDKVKALIKSAVQLGFDSGDSSKPISRAAFLQLGTSALRGGRAPGEADEGPGPDDQSCSLATNPNCGKLEDKFMEIAGEVDSDITVYNIHLDDLKRECKEERENYESQIDDLRSRLDAWQTALAEATTRSIQARAGFKLKDTQYGDLLTEHMETRSECEESLSGMSSEICAMRKIRGELYKMSAIASGIVDCEVSDWKYEGCSKDCMESDTDTPGVENLTREEITSPTPELDAQGNMKKDAQTGKELLMGQACPPAKLTKVCNKIRCPINCIQSEWSEWSGCSSQCGGGIRERIRSVKRTARFQGDPCGPASETETCNPQDCDKDCALAPWTKIQDEWCSKACGGGVKVSTRAVFAEAIGQGKCPEPLSAERFRQMECNLELCAPVAKAYLVCDAQVDVVILLDGSGSLGKTGWKATVATGKLLADAFDTPGIQAQVAVQLFSGPNTWYRWYLCTGRIKWRTPNPVQDCGMSWVTPLSVNTGHFSKDMKNTAELIGKLQFPARATFTGMALGEAEAELSYGREGVPKVVVVVTDGWPTFPYKATVASTNLKKVARLIWAPVGPNTPKDEVIKQWASTPGDQNIVRVKNWDDLETPSFVTQIIAEVCPKAH